MITVQLDLEPHNQGYSVRIRGCYGEVFLSTDMQGNTARVCTTTAIPQGIEKGALVFANVSCFCMLEMRRCLFKKVHGSLRPVLQSGYGPCYFGKSTTLLSAFSPHKGIKWVRY